MMRQTISLLLVSWMIVVGLSRCADAQEKMPRLIGEILPSLLADPGQIAQIKAFDIATDGTVGVLYASWGSSPHPTATELWVAVWNTASDKLVWKQKLGTDTTSGAARIHDVKDLIFTAEHKHLLALTVKSVWRIEAKDGGTPVLIAPPADVSEAPVRISALIGTTAAVTYSQDEGSSFYTQLIDASSEKKINGWRTSAIPQSFSPDGKLAVIVTPGYGAVDVQVVDTSSGKTLRTLPVVVSYGKGHSRESVSAVARFLDNSQVVVAPSHVIDRQPQKPAYGLLVIDASDGRIVREIAPRYYRPAGDMIVSQNRNEFVVYSVYAREQDFRRESLHPKDLRINLFAFRKDSITPEVEIPNVYVSLAGGKGEPMRLSSDGSVLAVSESRSGSIKVFQINAPQ
jgi:hypothetical protein